VSFLEIYNEEIINLLNLARQHFLWFFFGAASAAIILGNDGVETKLDLSVAVVDSVLSFVIAIRSIPSC